MDTLPAAAAAIMEKLEPEMSRTIKDLLRTGESPRQITVHIAENDVFMAAIVEMALDHWKENTT